MNITVGDRFSGKTKKAIAEAKRIGGVLVVKTTMLAKNLEYRNPGLRVISFQDFRIVSATSTKFVIDDLDQLLQFKRNIHSVYMSGSCEVLKNKFNSADHLRNTIKMLGVTEFNRQYPSWAILPDN